MNSYDKKLGMFQFHKVQQNRNSVQYSSERKSLVLKNKFENENARQILSENHTLREGSIALCKTTDNVRKRDFEFSFSVADSHFQSLQKTLKQSLVT